MYKIRKTMRVEGAHVLKGDIFSEKCKRVHGHSWVITVEVIADTLTKEGMVADFGVIKKVVNDEFDHAFFNELSEFKVENPTAEHIAIVVRDLVQGALLVGHPNHPMVSRVEVQETQGNLVILDTDVAYSEFRDRRRTQSVSCTDYPGQEERPERPTVG